MENPRNWQHMLRQTKIKKVKTQLNTSMCWIPQTQITQRRHEPSYKQLVVKTNRTEHSFYEEIVTDITTRNSERKVT
jgi:hypothetical protein